MTSLLVDTSVIIKWFHTDGEGELEEARLLREAHVRGQISAHVIDLALYEVGNVLVRALEWDATAVAHQLDDMVTIVGPPIAPTQAWLRDAAALAADHQLSFYDACWAAAARGLGISLVSADRRLVRSGLAESPSDAARRLRL